MSDDTGVLITRKNYRVHSAKLCKCLRIDIDPFFPPPPPLFSSIVTHGVTFKFFFLFLLRISPPEKFAAEDINKRARAEKNEIRYVIRAQASPLR